MPVTARLSKRFYDRLGDDIANDLVDWFNSVDATYRLDLRETNELNFARFDAKVGQRFAESEAKFDRQLVELEARINQRFVELEARFDKKLAELEARIDKRFVELEARIDMRFAKMETQMAERETRLMRWMFGFWITNTLALAGLALAIFGAR